MAPVTSYNHGSFFRDHRDGFQNVKLDKLGQVLGQIRRNCSYSIIRTSMITRNTSVCQALCHLQKTACNNQWPWSGWPRGVNQRQGQVLLWSCWIKLCKLRLWVMAFWNRNLNSLTSPHAKLHGFELSCHIPGFCSVPCGYCEEQLDMKGSRYIVVIVVFDRAIEP